MNDTPAQFTPGTRVTVTQQVQHKGWTAAVTGVIESVGQSKTGSWFAHAKDDRLWLDRLTLKKDDGEIVVCNLDRYSRVELAAADAPDDETSETHDTAAEPSGGGGGGS